MRLAWLEVVDVRSYERATFRPGPDVNVLVGANASGKTTILEAVAYLATMRSFRGTPDVSLIRIGTSEAILRGGFADAAGEHKVEVAIPAEGRRRVLVEGKRPARLRDLLSRFPVVAFQPDDLDLVKRGPGGRRGYLDDLAAQLWPQAAAAQTDMERALRQRNTLLRQEGRHTDRTTLDVWDERLAVAGAAVAAARRRVIEVGEQRLREAYAEIAGRDEGLSWRYDVPWATGDGVQALATALAAARERDLELRTTSVGPHRDDPTLWLGERPVRVAASQGEQRTTALALRLAAFRAIVAERDLVPVLLLDDVFSELDRDRVAGVVRELPEGQVLVTTAREDEVPIAGRRWRVGGGVIEEG